MSAETPRLVHRSPPSRRHPVSKPSPSASRAATSDDLRMFADAVAHEIRQPLTGIAANASACLGMLTGVPDIAGALQTAHRTLRDVQRATEVIERVRWLFVEHCGVRSAVDLNAIVREAIAICADELGRSGVTVRCRLAEKLAPVLGDQVQLCQVILNLLGNALDAMRHCPEGSRLMTVTTRSQPRNRVMLRVRDCGVGFMPDQVDRLFQPLYTTKLGGMGMGLCISRLIVERHGGRIVATSRPAVGSTFALILPAMKAAADIPAEDRHELPRHACPPPTRIVDEPALAEHEWLRAWRRES